MNDSDDDIIYCEDCGSELSNHSKWEFSDYHLCYKCFIDRNGGEL